MIAGTYEPAHCGVVHYTDHLRGALRRHGIPTLVLTTRAAARVAGDLGVRGVVDGWGVAALPALAHAVKESGADLLHIEHAAGSYRFRRAVFFLPPLLRAAGWRGPLVTTVHEYGWWKWQPPLVPHAILDRMKGWGERHGWWDEEDGCLLTMSDALITTDPDIEGVLLGRLPSLAPRVERIPLAANVEVVPVAREEARAALRRAAGWPRDATVVAFFGFLHPVKGLETLLAAFARVADARPETRLLLLGGVESLALPGERGQAYCDTLRVRIGELGLTDRVHITGYVPAAEASRFLSGADLGVLPFYGGLTPKSGSLLALLGHGLPPVVTRHEPPIPELAEAVVQVAPRDADALADGLLALLADPAARQRLTAAGRQLVADRTWPAIAARHAAIYDAVLAARAAREVVAGVAAD